MVLITVLLNKVHIIFSVCESFFFPVMNRRSLYFFWVKKKTHKNWPLISTRVAVFSRRSSLETATSFQSRRIHLTHQSVRGLCAFTHAPG